jgi:hypothetical protein
MSVLNSQFYSLLPAQEIPLGDLSTQEHFLRMFEPPVRSFEVVTLLAISRDEVTQTMAFQKVIRLLNEILSMVLMVVISMPLV